jgi:undecaprenyl-diphosphatase
LQRQVEMMAAIDHGTAEAVHAFAMSHAWLTLPVIVITAAFIGLCPLALVIIWVRDRELRAAVATLIGLGLADKVSHTFGTLHYVRRPFVVMHFTPLFPHAPNNSFPSSTVAFAAVAAIVVLFAWRRLGMVLAVGAVVIAFGCIYVGVHYVSDVIVGAAIGLVCGTAAWFAVGWGPAARLLAAIEHRLPGHPRAATTPARRPAPPEDIRAR